jgi:predicted lipoprotein with Yx(FWY)xxD motif
LNRKTYAIALLAALAALIVAGCGSSGDSTSSTGTEATSATSGEAETAATKPVTAAPNAEKGTVFVSLGNAGDVGMVLVDSKGMTLYEFEKDQGTQSSCYGACAEAWPPLLTTGEPQPSNGSDGSLLGTTKRKDGTTQVTYSGHPLYGFVEDKKPGEANGNDVTAFGADWYALTSKGEEPESSGDSGSESSADDSGETTSASPGGGGY